MSLRIAVYDALNVTAVFMGIPLSDGLADDAFIKIVSPEVFAAIGGVDGLVMMYRKAGCTIYGVEVKLKGASLHHAEFAALHAADYTSVSGAGIAPAVVKDNNGTQKFAAIGCRIIQAPEHGYGESKPDGTWRMIAVADPRSALPGGN